MPGHRLVERLDLLRQRLHQIGHGLFAGFQVFVGGRQEALALGLQRLGRQGRKGIGEALFDFVTLANGLRIVLQFLFQARVGDLQFLGLFGPFRRLSKLGLLRIQFGPERSGICRQLLRPALRAHDKECGDQSRHTGAQYDSE